MNSTIGIIILVFLFMISTVLLAVVINSRKSSSSHTKTPFTKAEKQLPSMTNAFIAEDVLSKAKSECSQVIPSNSSVMWDQCLLLFWPKYISMMFGKSDNPDSIPTMCDVSEVVSPYGYNGIIISNLQPQNRSSFTLRFKLASQTEQMEFLVYLTSNTSWSIKIVNVDTQHTTVITDNTNYTTMHDQSFNFCGRIGNDGFLGINSHPASLWLSMP